MARACGGGGLARHRGSCTDRHVAISVCAACSSSAAQGQSEPHFPSKLSFAIPNLPVLSKAGSLERAQALSNARWLWELVLAQSRRRLVRTINRRPPRHWSEIARKAARCELHPRDTNRMAAHVPPHRARGNGA